MFASAVGLFDAGQEHFVVEDEHLRLLTSEVDVEMLVAEVGVVEAFVAVKQNVETLEPGFGFVMAASWAFEEVEDYWEWPTVQVALALEIEGDSGYHQGQEVSFQG